MRTGVAVDTVHWCPACQHDVVAFGPGGPRGRANAKCPVCGALERHRFLARLLDQHGPLLATSDVVLDIAPQPQIAGLLRRLSGSAYVAADLFADLAVDVQMDLTQMPLATSSVDAIVCYHVLEHIPDDLAAMRELARVLKPGGLLFMQVPWRRGRPTDEDPSAPVEVRIERFGQDDHVRYYGFDLEDRLRASGLRPGRIEPAAVLTTSELSRYGIPGRDAMWICRPAETQLPGRLPAEATPDARLGMLRTGDPGLVPADGHRDRLEIRRLRAEALSLRRQVEAGGMTTAGIRSVLRVAGLKRQIRRRLERLYHRLAAHATLGRVVRIVGAGYRQLSAARQRRSILAGPAGLAAATDSAARKSSTGLPAASMGPGDDPTANRGTLSVACVDDPGAWIDVPELLDYDIVVPATPTTASSLATATSVLLAPTAATVEEAARRWRGATGFALCIATPDRATASGWGDTHLARDVQAALRRQGLPARVYLRDEFHNPAIASADVCIHLHGRALPPLHASQLNVLWVISHPDRLDLEQVNRYDLVAVASRTYATKLQRLVRPPVVPLLQATDVARFTPDRPGPHHSVLFVGNSRLTERRTIIDDLTPTHLDLAIYGRDWHPDFVDPRFVKGEFVPNDDLAGYYAAADVVLNDHWPSMAAEGFISNRLYDALASGACVVSDAVEGLSEEFDDGLATYRGRDDLIETIDVLLADPDTRHELAQRGRAAVLQRHTFDHRVARLLGLVDPLLPGGVVRLDGTSPAGSEDTLE